MFFLLLFKYMCRNLHQKMYSLRNLDQYLPQKNAMIIKKIPKAIPMILTTIPNLLAPLLEYLVFVAEEFDECSSNPVIDTLR